MPRGIRTSIINAAPSRADNKNETSITKLKRPVPVRVPAVSAFQTLYAFIAFRSSLKLGRLPYISTPVR